MPKIVRGPHHQQHLFTVPAPLQPDPNWPLPVEFWASPSGTNGKILLNGMDITPWVTDLDMSVGPGMATRVTLELVNVEVNRVQA